MTPEFDRERLSPRHPDAFWQFVRRAWGHMGEPVPLVECAYMRATCDVLQRTALRTLPDLLTNIPPGHSKSVLHNIMYCAWIWSWDPTRRFIYLSYDETLVMRDAEKCKILLESAWYQARWPLELRKGSQAKKMYYTAEGGFRSSGTIRGGITGKHCDDMIIDDPQNPTKLSADELDESTAEAALARHVWDQTLQTRFSDYETSRRIVVMQRLSEMDLSQHIIDTTDPAGLTHLCLPLQYDPDHAYASPHDHRTVKGELLAPERFKLETIEKRLFVNMSDGAIAAQFDQNPTASGAGFFKQTEFTTHTAAPDRGVMFVSVDGATSGRARGISAKAAAARSRWAFTFWVLDNGTLYLIDWLAFRDDFTVVLGRLQTFIADNRRPEWRPGAVVLEKKSTGEAAHSMLRSLSQNADAETPVYQGFSLELWNPGTNSKTERAEVALPIIRAGKLSIPENVWTAPDDATRLLRSELLTFPAGKSDDLVDTLTQVVLYTQRHKPRELPSAEKMRKLSTLLQRRR